jgi:hypothetical protein
MILMAASEFELKARPAMALAHGGDAEQGSAVQIAEAIARAVGEVPGVAALSPGRDVTVATHGPGKAVRGIVMHQRADGSLEVEVHVVVAEAALEGMLARLRADPATPDAAQKAVLPVLAEEIRRHVVRAVQGAVGRAPALVDVYFDDLQ